MYEEDIKILKELDMLKEEHKELNEAIGTTAGNKISDQLTLQRLKKRKLWLKERILMLESLIYPDIIA
jgi:hypothetical protein